MKNDNVKLKIILRIKRHWLAISISSILGLLMILPFFYFQISLGDVYKGILPQIVDDELFYLARIKDVIDGHPTLGNAYLFEHKNQLPQQLFLPEWLLAQPLKFLNLDIVQGRILYNFILPTLAFILAYIAFYLIYPSKFWANLFSVFLFFGIYLFKFTRPVIPQFVFLFWLTQFILLWLLVKDKRDKYNDIMIYHRISKKFISLLNILNFGLLFYIYPFYWTFYLVFFVVLSFVYFFQDPEGVRQNGPYPSSRAKLTTGHGGAGKLLSKQFLKILIGGLIIGSFYFYLTFLASRLPEYQETLTRLQLVFSRSPSEVKSVALSLAVLVLIGILYRLKKIKINKEILFFIAGIVSILIVTNQNILTGQKFEFGHYRMTAVFFLAFAVYYLLVPYETARARSVILFRMGWTFLIIIVSVSGIYGYTQRITKISDQDIYRQKYAVIFNWLNENTPKDSVVYANEDISSLIPVYTSNNVFYSRYANLFIMSGEEVSERFILNNFSPAYGGSAAGGEKFDRDFVIENERAIWGVRYVDRYGDAVQSNKWRKILGVKLKPAVRLPEEEIEKFIAKAQEIQKETLGQRLKNYRIDYIIWDTEKNPNWQFNRPKSLKEIFKYDSFVIYKI